LKKIPNLPSKQNRLMPRHGKNQQKGKGRASTEPKKAAAASEPLATQPASPLPSWLVYLVLMLLAFVLYGNTISHEYALDDAIVITDNSYTQEGFSGLGDIFSTDAFEGYFKEKKNLVAGGRYRPLSIATFAIEIDIFGQNPHVSHFFNVLLYGFTGIAVFLLMGLLIPGLGDSSKHKWWASLPFLVSVLFMAHPLHTEVVANIKGRDEILAMLFVLTGMYFLLRQARDGNLLFLAMGVVAFFLALLSKETALPFLVVVPLAAWFFRIGAPKIQKYALLVIGLVVPIAVYLVIRSQVIGELAASGTDNEILNDPFLYASFSERLATVSHTLGLYLYKFFVPLNLSHDYYFNQIPVIGWGRVEAIVPAVIYLSLGGLTIWGTVKRHPAAFGLWWFFINLFLVSNIAVTVGTTMAERFMYLPSLGLIFALVVLLFGLGKRIGQKQLALGVVGVLVALFAVRTVMRNPVWKDNLTLFTTDAYHSPNSAKVRTAAGGALVDGATTAPLPPALKRNKMLDEAIGHLNEAVKIYPEHGQAWLLLGNAYFNRDNQYEKALNCFQMAILYRPGLADAYKNAAVTSSKMKRFDLSASYYKAAAALRPNEDVYWYEMGITYEEWGKPDSALYAFQNAVNIQPANADALGKIAMIYGKFYQQFDQAIEFANRAIALKPTEEGFYENLGIAYAMKGDLNSALNAFSQGLKTLPNSAKLHLNVGITYQNMGDSLRAQESFSKAFALDPGLRPN
jgi:Flp pilus assembly protein TadD